MGKQTTLARLTMETAFSHAAIDEALLGPLEFPTASGFRRFLCMIYGFQAPLEAALVMTPEIDFAFLEERSKAGRIANDLMSLGLTRREFQLLARRSQIGPFANVADALGFMYATERLAIPIEELRVRLESEVPIVLSLASQFMTTYRHVAEMRWFRYGVLLDRAAKKHGIDTIVASARAGVEALQRWLVESGATVETTTTATAQVA